MSKEIALPLESGKKKIGSTYLKLTKPKVVALMLITAVVGMSLAPVVDFPWLQAAFGLFGIGLMAGSAAVGGESQPRAGGRWGRRPSRHWSRCPG